MLFNHFGNQDNPAVVLLHGGGLSWWMWQPQIAALEKDYHIIAPVFDGHGADACTFSNISDSADRLIAYIDEAFKGRVFALCGFSLGAQVALDAMAKRPGITEFALIESALIESLGLLGDLTLPLIGLSYGLISKRWFARAQAKQLFIPDNCFETYFESSQKISKASLTQMMRSNAAFRASPELAGCAAKTLILAGEKEIPAIIKSANHLGELMPNAKLWFLPCYRHGELCLRYPDEYIRIFHDWVAI